MPTCEVLSYISAEDYLVSEVKSANRREYLDGGICAMDYVTSAHNLIAGNLFVALRGHLRGHTCSAFASNMKVWIKAAAAIYYPDVFVTCEAHQNDSRVMYAPVLVIEVTSKSTENMDRREKLINYRKLDSLREYALVHQHTRCVELLRRRADGQWELLVSEDGDEVIFESLPNGRLMMSMDELYEGVRLDPVASADED